jgi:hypothetical protein
MFAVVVFVQDNHCLAGMSLMLGNLFHLQIAM